MGGITLTLVSQDGHQIWFEIAAVPRGRCGGMQWGPEEDGTQLGELANCTQLGLLCNWVWVGGSDGFEAPSPHPSHCGVSYCDVASSA